jgi:hypothetical protein
MNTSRSYPEWLDIEVSTLAFMLDHGQWAPHEISGIKRQLEDRKAQIMAGLGSMTQLYWTMKVQRELDECSRVRRDPAHGWMLDRWVEDLKCWQPVGYIGTGGRLEEVDGADASFASTDADEKSSIRHYRVIEDKVRPDLIAYLREHDMQRSGYLEGKAAAAKAIRVANEKQASDRVLAAVDSLSTKQIKEFVEVEKAIQTGETVTMHGETLRQFDKMTEAGKKAPDGPESSNPGVHPLRHKRDYSKGEGEHYGDTGT